MCGFALIERTLKSLDVKVFSVDKNVVKSIQRESPTNLFVGRL